MVKTGKKISPRKPTRAGELQLRDPLITTKRRPANAIGFVEKVWEQLRQGAPAPAAEAFGLAPSAAAALARQCRIEWIEARKKSHFPDR